MRSTHTLALMAVSALAFDDIRRRVIEIDERARITTYQDDMFLDGGKRIAMHGIAVEVDPLDPVAVALAEPAFTMSPAQAMRTAFYQLTHYGQQHRAKGTPEADSKALVNERLASAMLRALQAYEKDLFDADQLAKKGPAPRPGAVGVNLAAAADRFCAWRLPENFHPDAGITFKAEFNNGTPEGGRHRPTGTNLLSHSQATDMLRHVLEDQLVLVEGAAPPPADTVQAYNAETALRQEEALHQAAQLLGDLVEAFGPWIGKTDKQQSAVERAAAYLRGDPVLASEEHLPEGMSSADQEPKYAFVGGRIVNRASGEVIPLDEPVFVFRARDTYAEAMLLHYQALVKDTVHEDAVSARIHAFDAFRKAHPERMKEPDTAPAPWNGHGEAVATSGYAQVQPESAPPSSTGTWDAVWSKFPNPESVAIMVDAHEKALSALLTGSPEIAVASILLEAAMRCAPPPAMFTIPDLSPEEIARFKDLAGKGGFTVIPTAPADEDGERFRALLAYAMRIETDEDRFEGQTLKMHFRSRDLPPAPPSPTMRDALQEFADRFRKP